MIEFRDVYSPPLNGFSIRAQGGVAIGILGERDAGKTTLLKLAAGIERPDAGQVISEGTGRYLGPADKLIPAPVDLLALDNTFALKDAIVRARGLVALERLRRAGTTILLASHETALLRAFCDEVWWLRDGQLAWRGHPQEVIEAYNGYIAETFRDWGETLSDTLVPAMRRGEARAEVIELTTLGQRNRPTQVWSSGENVSVRARVRYNVPTAAPVIGLMIRTRAGVEVYGTNTEAAHKVIGAVVPGDIVTVNFSFRCDLCPLEYTLTVASYDADGTAHDLAANAVSFTVTDDRPTPGVANLRAHVSVKRDLPAEAGVETVQREVSAAE